ncbi:LytR/AlgR family response regulator transcription factor [Xanthomarina sp. F2636L]|uniref:LytR/AlgR family response regulator transcription factor n=1 Tax=Xanthomarina sp. F2636L TaxID=2996018 RepID=UPI00225E5DF6|nr:response regulator [Xanthomarina sp. F2636L]MCX7551883.1 response regulator [Xanthomarina sp. F2636L]
MEKVKILVVEDEIIIADNICDTLDDLGYEALEPAINYSEAIERIEEEKPDIAILDIQLSGAKTGIDLAKKIKKNYNFPFIFLTSNADVRTVTEAKKVMPPAYLIKPFTKEELYTSIEIALYNHSSKTGQVIEDNLIVKDALFVKDKGVFSKLLFKDILYLKSAHVYVEIVLKDKQTQVLRISLNEIIEKMNEKFIRVHRGYIINLDYLEQIDNASLRINKVVIPIGKKYRENLLHKINLI